MIYYTVLFGVSRAFGVAAQLIWDRALGARTCGFLLKSSFMLIMPTSSRAPEVVLERGDQEDVRGQAVDACSRCLVLATAASAEVADVVLIIPYCIVGLIKREDTLISICCRECTTIHE